MFRFLFDLVYVVMNVVMYAMLYDLFDLVYADLLSQAHVNDFVRTCENCHYIFSEDLCKEIF